MESLVETHCRHRMKCSPAGAASHRSRKPAIALLLATASAISHGQCTKDTDCKGERICDHGSCAAPPSKQVIQPTPKAAASATLEDRVGAALEDQLKCAKAPEPGKALRALRMQRLITNEPLASIDGMTVWGFTRPISVFGYAAIEVTGWEEKPDRTFFWRGPGTAPPVNITVVVEGEPRKVEDNLKRKLGPSVQFGKAYFSQYKRPATEIACNAP